MALLWPLGRVSGRHDTMHMTESPEVADETPASRWSPEEEGRTVLQHGAPIEATVLWHLPLGRTDIGRRCVMLQAVFLFIFTF